MASYFNFQQIYSNLKKLILLQVEDSDCDDIDTDEHPPLNHLYLTSTAFPVLTHLEIGDWNEIKTIIIEAPVKYVEIIGCKGLKSFQLKGTSLQRLIVRSGENNKTKKKPLKISIPEFLKDKITKVIHGYSEVIRFTK